MFKLCLLILSSTVAYVHSAVALYPYQPKPAAFAGQEGCYIDDLNMVLPYNKPYYPKDGKSCLQYTCQTNNLTQLFSCGRIGGLTDNCHLENDYSLDYPDCCEKPVCDPTTTTESPTTEPAVTETPSTEATEKPPSKDPIPPKAPREPKAPKDPKAPQKPKAPQNPKSPQQPLAPECPKAPDSPKNSKIPKDSKSPKVIDANKRYKLPVEMAES